ncbi:MAG: YifB family Mg chelatase-like AAA ATPase [Candidatus Nanopelagicales bacterium]|nr:YifB family Mg chelatase-like AAA ATPase [Candidatus Nanopelagicales bacterium]
MGLARVQSAVVIGVRAHVVEVEAHLAPGLPGLTLVGLADTAVNESRDRVRAAVANSGLRWPGTRITVGLSPAGLPKRGPGLDLAIALAVLAADGQVSAEDLAGVMALGELGLDGRIRPVAGALAASLTAADCEIERVITGCVDARQVGLVPSLRVTSAADLRCLVAELRGEVVEPPETPVESVTDSLPVGFLPTRDPTADLADVMGQEVGKRALEVAAAGGHHLALLGRAGVGKTLLAERLVDLLPDLGERESLEITAIAQLSGGVSRHVMTRPPFQAPHHTASRVAMVGGGSDRSPTVGVVSLAHRGVLFLDEATEFEPNVLDALREPIDAGGLTIVRAAFRITYPARFQLVIAANPCPCGNALDTRGPACTCTPAQRRKYLGRLSGPLMDRIDVRAVLTRPTLAELSLNPWR